MSEGDRGTRAVSHGARGKRKLTKTQRLVSELANSSDDEAAKIASENTKKNKKTISDKNNDSIREEVADSNYYNKLQSAGYNVLPGVYKELQDNRRGNKGIRKKIKESTKAVQLTITGDCYNNYLSRRKHYYFDHKGHENSRNNKTKKASSSSANSVDDNEEPLVYNYNEEFNTILELHLMKAGYWLWLTTQQKNILFYGFGSKKKLLSEFTERFLKGSDVVEIDGNNSKCSSQSNKLVKALLNTIAITILKMKDLQKSCGSIIHFAKVITGNSSATLPNWCYQLHLVVASYNL